MNFKSDFFCRSYKTSNFILHMLWASKLLQAAHIFLILETIQLNFKIDFVSKIKNKKPNFKFSFLFLGFIHTIVYIHCDDT